ncbi:PTS sugar transporter subunit IIC [Spiroplasma culicicola]|uniref:PTS system cellobiose-specific component IIC n=1 Tax=Spiroplasma culicicola AES-1 TaxID=1276246 RepID=W6AH46_9MOLU|nr:PTS transporter subunit EIIC [Spiroplasma culicicola]AHI53009.1 PTS system cellobiose-specific component IIC [Spiroplasma culicicola AES-1]
MEKEKNSKLKELKLLQKKELSNLKNEKDLKLQDKNLLKFEKELLIEQYKNSRSILKSTHSLQIKELKNPEKFEKNKKQKTIEEEISKIQVDYFKNINKEKRKYRKLIKGQTKAERKIAQQEFKTFILEQKQDLKLSIEETKTKGEINSIRYFKNSFTNKAKDIHGKMMPVLGKIANQKHLMAIRNAFSSLIPFIMIASFITVIRSIPTSFDPTSEHAYLYTYFPEVLDHALVIISSLTMGVMALALSIAIGINLGQNYGEAPLMSGIMGMLGFILWVKPAELAENGGTSLPLADLGSQGLFVSMLTSMLMFELYRIFKKYRITIRLPKGVPPAVSNSFTAIIPALVYATFVILVAYIGNVDLISGMNNILKPLASLVNDNFGAVIMIIFFNSLFWWFGIHGSAITGIITYPIWYPAIAENSEWWNNGMIGDVPNVFVEQYYQWTIWIGGSGATIGLAICGILFSKSKQNKAMGKACFVPGVFNISEPMMFGFPVVLNIYLFIPFMLAPMICAVASLALVSLFNISWVAVAPWSLPAPIGAFLSSGNNVFAIITALICTGIATLVYLPFYKVWDKQILKEEQKNISKEAEKLGLSINEYMKKMALEEIETKKIKRHEKLQKVKE